MISQGNKRRVIALSLGSSALLVLCLAPSPSDVSATPIADEVMRLSGKLVDFNGDHPDFEIGSTGHQVWNVSRGLGPDGRPVYDGAGATVANQWYDKNGAPIMPSGSDPGLPGGHFDIDAYDAPSDHPRRHEHEYDDKYDVTGVDLLNGPNLKYVEIIGADYPNDLRVVFTNEHHGSGTYTVQVGADVLTGPTQGGFETTFSPADLTQFRVDLASLADLRKTTPRDAKQDIADRDDSFAIRMYDVTTDEMVYELVVYHHYDGPAEPEVTFDRCGDQVLDVEGSFSALGLGGITDQASFDQWYKDELGVNQSGQHDISLTTHGDGVYEYLTDDFFPADGRLLGNEGDAHNNNFTYSIKASFTYNQCTAQFFEFEGNDDAWVFIDNQMVLDLGGTSTPQRQRISLDRLNLVEGETYQLDFFYAYRRATVDSTFRMRTNIWLESDVSVAVNASFD